MRPPPLSGRFCLGGIGRLNKNAFGLSVCRPQGSRVEGSWDSAGSRGTLKVTDSVPSETDPILMKHGLGPKERQSG